MPVIESYSFGRMIIDGRSFSKDIIIFPDNSILSPWWRNQGHSLEISDLENLIDMTPEVIIAGTGSSGLVRPTTELEDLMAQRSIKFVAQPTGEAVMTYNKISGTRRTGGCFHLTC